VLPLQLKLLELTYNNNGTLGNGTAAATPNWTTAGKSGGAYVYDGVDDLINYGDGASITNMSQFTLEAWIKPEDNGYIISKRGPGCTQVWRLAVDSSQFAFFRTTSTGQISRRSPTTNVNFGNWHHIILTWNGSLNYESLKFYVNGTETNYASNTSGTGSFGSTIGCDLVVGNREDGTVPFNGTIDEIRIYNRTLSPEQILANYNNGIPRYNVTVSNETAGPGENWTVCVTPNNATVDGTTLCSNNLTIQNSAPTHTTPIINATTVNNLTTDNLTAYNQTTNDLDGDTVNNMFDWRLNGTSIAVLNMNFDVNDSAGSGKTRDYSTFQNNGTTSGSPIWNSGIGRDETGAYKLDGTNADIVVDSVLNELNVSNPWTVTGSFNISGEASDDQTIFSFNDVSDSEQITIQFKNESGENNIKISSNGKTPGTGSVISIGRWYDFAFTWNGTDFSAYLDGVLDYSVTPSSAITWGLIDGARIGSTVWTGSKTEFFNGTIDNIKVYNRTLSSDQILALHNNLTNTIVSNETGNPGENWKVCITPNDATVDGTTRCSNDLVILTNNSAPTHTTPILNATTVNNLTTDNLTAYNQTTNDIDGDTVNNMYDWRVNGTSIAVLNMNFDVNNSGGTNITKDYSTYGNNGTVGNNNATRMPFWNATGGFDGGGAYQFDGVDDYINLSNTSSLVNLGPYTITVWVKPTNAAFDYILSSRGGHGV